jgi:hypothetical protein
MTVNFTVHTGARSNKNVIDFNIQHPTKDQVSRGLLRSEPKPLFIGSLVFVIALKLLLTSGKKGNKVFSISFVSCPQISWKQTVN